MGNMHCYAEKSEKFKIETERRLPRSNPIYLLSGFETSYLSKQKKNSCRLFQRALCIDKYNGPFWFQDCLEKKVKKEAIRYFLLII